MSGQNTSSKTNHLHFTLRDNMGLTMGSPSYKVGLFSIQGKRLGEAELKSARAIVLKIDSKEYLGKIPGFFDRQIELIDNLRNVVIYRSKRGFFLQFPIVVFDDNGNEVFQVTRQFWGQRYTALHKDQEIAVMRKKRSLSRAYSLSLDKSFFSDYKDPAALFMMILLMKILDDVASAALSV